MQNEFGVNIRGYTLDDGVHIALGQCVVSIKVLHHQVHFELEDAGKEGIGFVGIDIGMVGPIGVWVLIPPDARHCVTACRGQSSGCAVMR